MFIKKTKKIFILILIFSILSPSAFFIKSQKVEAMAVVEVGPQLWKSAVTAISTAGSFLKDSGRWFKEFVADPTVYAISRIIIQKMVAETVNWINTGFEGNPMFVTDLNGFMTDTADEIIGEYIYGSKLSFLCSPFSMSVKLALMQQFTGGYEPRCTLSEVTNNIDGAIDDLSNQWDWDTWNSITQNSNNNAFGSYIETSVRINAEIENKKKEELEKLGWGNGFFSPVECTTYADIGGEQRICSIKTPGGIVKDMTFSSIDMGNKTLVEADEIAEIASALLGQLYKKVLGPEGLIGASKSSGGQPSYTNQLMVDQGDTSGIVNNTLDSLDVDIQNENSYLTPKQDSLNAVNISKTKLETLNQCYIRKAIEADQSNYRKLWNEQSQILTSSIANSRASTASTTITTTLQPILDRITPQVSLVKQIIETLNTTQSDVLKATTVNELSLAIENYQNIQRDGTLHTIQEIVDAEQERSGIVNQMNTINTATDTKIEECESYVYTSDLNN